MVVATAGGKVLDQEKGRKQSMSTQDLTRIIAEYQALPAAERTARPEDPAKALPPTRPVPDAPADGLVIRSYCTYMKRGEAGSVERTKQFYYKQNPDAWAAETQSDMLWLTRAERESLIPSDPAPGRSIAVSRAIQKRFYSTIGIDFMEGSVNALPVLESEMTITVEALDGDVLRMRLEGHGAMGKAFDPARLDDERSRGCALRVLGYLEVNAETKSFTRFDLVGVGRAWGNKMEYTNREISFDEIPWHYGIACELVTGQSPIDKIPPYNLLHYGAGLKYWE
jgi:hypothetical protein